MKINSQTGPQYLINCIVCTGEQFVSHLGLPVGVFQALIKALLEVGEGDGWGREKEG